MQIIDFKGKKWLIGLEWEKLPGDAAIKVEAKEVAEKTNQNYGLLIDYDQEVAIGLVKANSKVPSAALYLALANQEFRQNISTEENYPDWIVIEEIGDDKYWLGVVNGGIPSPGYDAVFDITTIKQKIDELLINDTYRFYSPCGEIISLFDHVKTVENKSINNLTEEVKTKIKFDKLRGIPNSVVYAGIGLCALIAAGIGISTFFEGRNLQEKIELAQKEKERQEMEEKIQYEKSMAAYNEGVKTAKQAAYDSIRLGLSGYPKQIMDAWISQVGDMAFGTHGWQLTDIQCYFNPEITTDKIGCDYKFVRTGLATYRMLMQDYPGIKIVGNDAVLKKVINIDSSLIATPPESVLEKLPHSSTLNYNMVSQLQLLKIVDIDHKLKESIEITYTPPQKPLSKEEMMSGVQATAPVPTPVEYAKGDIDITGNGLAMLKELSDNVDFDGVGLKKIAFKVNGFGDITWNATFNYFIKTNQGLIGSSNSSTLSNSTVATKPANEVPTNKN